MANDNFFKRLGKLFSTNIIMKNTGGKKLRVIDINDIQQTETNFLVDRFHRLHTPNRVHGYDNERGLFQTKRLELFKDYEEMDNDPIISSALDIYADESTVKDEFGDVLTINSSNHKIKEILHSLFYDTLNLEFNLWPWVRNLVKYGDFFLKLDISSEYGVVNIIPLSPYELVRDEQVDDKTGVPDKVTFRIEGSSHMTGPSIMEFEDYEIAHFRLLSDTNFLPYGKSMIENGRKIWKQLSLMEDAMLIHRVMRAPEKRVFKIDIGNIPPNEVDNYMQQIINKMKKTPLIDQTTGEYNMKYNMSNLIEDFYMPVRGGDSGTEIDSLAGLSYEAVDDIEYLRNKMMAALKIPTPYLGYDEGVEGKSTLAAMDIRFARTIERIQRIVLSELYKIAVIHLFAQGFTKADLVDFDLDLTNPSTIYDEERIALWDSKTSLASSLVSDKIMSSQWVYENVWKMSEDEIKKVRSEIVEDQKRIFRFTQIGDEGNDPVKSNQSFGTPHDLASIHSADNEKPLNFGDTNFEVPDGGWEGAGRPDEGSKFKQPSHPRGRDPLGTQQMKNRKLEKPTHKYKGGSPLSREQVESFVSGILNKKKMISESIKVEHDEKKEDKTSLLDEKNIRNE